LGGVEDFCFMAEKRIEVSTAAFTVNPIPASRLSVTDARPSRIAQTSLVAKRNPQEARLRRANWSFMTRRVDQNIATRLLTAEATPEAGDVVLARIDALGHHANLHLPSGRKRHLFVGDEVVLAYGNRYASSQFEALVPGELGPCHLVAGGGMAGRAVSWHRSIVRGPTRITPLGLVGRADGRRINLRDFALRPLQLREEADGPTTIAVLGTSMDSGKTQSACFLARGLTVAGLRVGYAKATGTGAGGDVGWLEDAGADPVLDFTDVGMASTYLARMETLEQGMETLLATIRAKGVDAVLVEIADGVLQRETAALLQSETFNRCIDAVMLAAQDSMGAVAGVDWLRRHCARPVLAMCGVVSASPLQEIEAQAATGLEVYSREGLANPMSAMKLWARAQHRQDQLTFGNAFA
jgi:dethiobiotin synthetase